MTVPYVSNDEKPTLVMTIAILTLINGIVNIFWGLAATATVVSTLVLACLAGFTLLPTILGVFEIVYAAKLLAEPVEPLRPSQPIAVFEMLCVLTGNVFSMIVGILSLVFYNDPQVKEFFAHLNGLPVPVSPGPETHPAPPAAPRTPTRQPVKSPAKPAAARKPQASGSKKPPEHKASSKASELKAPKTKGTRKSGSSSS